MLRVMSRIAYLLGVAAAVSFFAGLLVVSSVERWGPAETSLGQVIDRTSEDKTVRNCGFRSRPRCTEYEYAAFSVIGERDDGTTWISVGEGPYRAMAGERRVTVSSSTLTGRVVGLVGEEDAWSVSSTGSLPLAIGGLLFVSALTFGYEHARRSGRWAMGAFAHRAEFLAVVPGIAVGLAVVWLVTWQNTWSLEVPTTAERFGTFLADPIGYADVQEAAAEEGGAGRLDRRFGPRGVDLVVVSRTHLGPDEQAAVEAASPVLAVPVLQNGGLSSSDRPLAVELFQDGTFHRPSACPAGLVDFPSTLGVDPDVVGGFVCFQNGVGGTLRFRTGSGAFVNTYDRSYEDPDGRIIEPGAG